MNNVNVTSSQYRQITRVLLDPSTKSEQIRQLIQTHGIEAVASAMVGATITELGDRVIDYLFR
jgi:hypothetical protein